jgi:glycosyltransferase involved in cell wall biosynthesis
MNILYDGSIFSYQAAGGVNHYISRLIDLAPQDVKPALATNTRRNVNYPTNPNLETLYFKRFWFKPGRLCFEMEKRYFRHRMLRGGFDIFHPSLYAENLAQVSLSAFPYPLVVTVHDMIDEIHPEVDPEGVRREQKAECIRRASALICVSHNTRADLLSRFPEAESKTHVIHNGCEIDTSSVSSRAGVPESPYFLFVGGRRSAYKNFKPLLLAMQKICKAHDSVKLVVAGSPPSDGEQGFIGELGLAGKVVFVPNPEEDLLARLYHWSIALAYPSVYEGFGIPPLEAMACGTCVVAANRSSIPEVVGDAAFLFDPSDPSALFEALQTVLDSTSLRTTYIERGSRRVLDFSWSSAVDKTVAVYKSVC